MASPTASPTAPARSRFLEGSMNDRVSNAPPPSFLGPDGVAACDEQFCLDGARPAPYTHHRNKNPAGRGRPSSRSGGRSGFIASNRNSFISVNSSKLTVGNGTPTPSHRPNNSSPGFLAPLWDGVRERLSLNRSKSSNSVKEDLAPAAHDYAHHDKLLQIPESGLLLSPDKTPSRDEIMQNYQSLVASGFFGTHAIQSTRYAKPGTNPNSNQQQHGHGLVSLPAGASFAERVEELGKRPQLRLQTNAARHPDPLLGDSDVMSSPTATITFAKRPTTTIPEDHSPLQENIPPQPSMPPPPIPTPAKPRSKPSPLTFSSVPYASTRPAADLPPRWERTRPPISIDRYSLDVPRRSTDGHRKGHQRDDSAGSSRGTKRPHADVEMGGVLDEVGSPVSPTRPQHLHVHRQRPSRGDGRDADTESIESGARKLVKKLRKSASRISVDLGRVKTRSSATLPSTAEEKSHDLPRPSISSLKRSFSWRLGNLGGDSGSGAGSGSKETSTSEAAADGNAAATSSTEQRPQLPGVQVMSDKERKKLKKKAIRDRRNARRNSSKSPRRSTGRPGSSGVRSSSPAPTFSTTARPGTAASCDESFFTTTTMTASPTGSSGRASRASTHGHGHGHGHEHARSHSETDAMEGVEFVVPSFHFPGRTRPGGPLSVVPDANRGIPSVPSIPALFKFPRRSGAQEQGQEHRIGSQGQEQEQEQGREHRGRRQQADATVTLVHEHDENRGVSIGSGWELPIQHPE